MCDSVKTREISANLGSEKFDDHFCIRIIPAKLGRLMDAGHYDGISAIENLNFDFLSGNLPSLIVKHACKSSTI